MYSTASTEVQFSVALIIIIIITKHYKTKKRQNICGQKYKLFNGTLAFNNDDKTSSDYQTFSTQRNIWKMAQQHNACSLQRKQTEGWGWPLQAVHFQNL